MPMQDLQRIFACSYINQKTNSIISVQPFLYKICLLNEKNKCHKIKYLLYLYYKMS